MSKLCVAYVECTADGAVKPFPLVMHIDPTNPWHTAGCVWLIWKFVELGNGQKA